jgi:hypothetical protein
MTDYALTALIAAMGAATVLLSLFVAYRFWWHHRNMQGDGRKLSIALFLQLCGEAVIGIVTLAFAVMAWAGKLPGVSIETQSFLRFIAFLATSATTVHLALVVEKIKRQ